MHKAMLSMASLALAVLPGCFGLGRGEPPQRHYVLGLGAEAPTGEAVGATVGLRPLKLAEYLETSYIVVRTGPHQIEFSEFHRWGESLARGINRTVAGYLAGREPLLRVEYAPWPARAVHDYVIQVQVLRFEGVAPEGPSATQGGAVVLASWEIFRGADGTLLTQGTTEYRGRGWTAGDYQGLVSLLEAGVSELADDLAAKLERMAAP